MDHQQYCHDMYLFSLFFSLVVCLTLNFVMEKEYWGKWGRLGFAETSSSSYYVPFTTRVCITPQGRNPPSLIFLHGRQSSYSWRRRTQVANRGCLSTLFSVFPAVLSILVVSTM